VEIGAEATQFPEKEYINGIAVAVLTKLSLVGNNLYLTSLFPSKESLVSDIPAGVGSIEKLFYGVH
jgi:hypothetical protein